MNTSKLLKHGLVLAMALPTLYACSSQTLKGKEQLTVEFGNPISTNVQDYLDTKDIDKEDLTKLLAETKLTIKDDKLVENQNYQSVGDYVIELAYEDEKAEVKVSVKDTTKPVFKDFKTSLEYTKDCKPTAEELSKQFVAEDLSKVTITVDDSKVDYSKEGTYKGTVKAVDEYSNEASQETTIRIEKPTIKLDVSKKSVYVKESFVLKPTVKGKDKKETFKSSNTSVATVSDSGKVTAKKQGSATITVTANGVNATCNVTVKKVPSGSKTTTTTVKNPTTGKQEQVVVVKPSTPPASSTSKASISMEALNLINKERAKLGRSPLKYDSTLGEIALKRAKEITTDFSHKGLKKYEAIYGDMGEVCAKLGSDNTPSHAVNGWMNSQGHRAVLMAEENVKIAVARCGNYWVGIVND